MFLIGALRYQLTNFILHLLKPQPCQRFCFLLIHPSSLMLIFQAIALFVACLCHDLDHRGKNNDWMKNESTPLAAVYTTSTLEHHHFNQTITILQVDYHFHF